MDQITIKDLIIYGKHGVFKEEQIMGQRFLVSAVLYVDTRTSGKSDNLKDSVNYGTVCHEMKNYLENHTFKLIEAAAEHMAEHLLLNFPLLKEVELELKKPWAPIGLPLDTVAVKIRRGWHTAYAALGSNMGDRKAFLDMAVDRLQNTKGIAVEKVSDFIETEPYGVTDQDSFLNGCLKLRTLMTPYELLECFHEIEQEADRVRTLRWGPRTLDLDILFYDDLVLDEEELTIPHKDMQNRDFVLLPMKQIAPWLRHPVLHKTIEQMEAELACQM